MSSPFNAGGTADEPAGSAAGMNEAWFLALLRQAPDFLALLDGNGVIRHMGSGVTRVIGHEPNEMTGRPLAEFVEPDDAAGLAAAFAALSNRSTPLTGTFRCRHKDGTSRSLEILAHNFRGDPQFDGIAVGARDVTNQGQVRQAVLPADIRYGLQVEDASDAIYFADQDLRFLDVNAATCRLFGYPREELLNRPIRDFIDADDLETTPFKIEELRAGRPIFLDRRVRRKDGTFVSVEVSARMLSSGVIQAITRDVTERRRMEQASRENEHHLRFALRMVDMAVFHQDRDLRYTWIISPQLDYEAGQVIGRTDTDLLPAATAERTMAIKRRVLETGDAAREEVIAVIGERTFHFDLAVESVRDDSGAITGLTGVSIDISKRVNQERALNAELNLADVVFKHSISGLVILDRDYNFIRINEAYAQGCRRSIDDLIGRNHFDLFPSDAKEIFDGVVLAKQPFETLTREFTFPDQPGRGTTYWDWTLVPVLDPQGEVEYLVFSVNEVTKRKRAELEAARTGTQLQALSKRLIEVQEEERRHISRELHAEIGQALTTLTLQLKTLRQSERTDPALIDQCVRITQIALEQVRDLSLDLRPPHLDDLGIEETLKWLLQRQTQATGWQTAIAVEALPARLAAPIETTCFRIAQEALTNAARHAQARNVEVDLRIVDGDLELLIRDDGSGFDPQSASLRQAERPSLGLVSMRERATLVGGEFAIASCAAGGTEIRFKVPPRYRV